MYGTGVVTCFMLTSTWITVVMALMRYVGICHPFSSRKIDGTRFSNIAYCVVCLGCFCFNIPSFCMYQTTEVELDGSTMYLLDIGFIDQASTIGKTFIWAKALLGILIPMGILSFCNCSLIRALRKSYQMRVQYRVPRAGTNNNSNRITLTLIVIMMAFLILVFPSEIMDLVHDHINKNENQTEVFLTVRSFANMFQIINYAFNFMLYCIINVHFRRLLLQMLPCCRKLFPNAVVMAAPTLARHRKTSFSNALTRTTTVASPKPKTAETVLNGNFQYETKPRVDPNAPTVQLMAVSTAR